jgi:hypothetical protein
MRTPEQWAAEVDCKMREREALVKVRAKNPDYEAFENEMDKLWCRTLAVFEEYCQAFCQKRNILVCEALERSLTIRRNDMEIALPLIVLFYPNGMFNGIELRFGERVRRYDAYMTAGGLELVCSDTDSRTSPEEIAADALEAFLISQ